MRRLPPAETIRDELRRVLASETFSRSARARDLLTYLVERDLEGKADRLKGFAIAVDVFGRDERFDPSTDTVVRVQAGRLRELLDQFYESEGEGPAGVRIAIPRGSYVPDYVEQHGPEVQPGTGASASVVETALGAGARPAGAVPRWRSMGMSTRLLTAGLAAAVILGGAAVLWPLSAARQAAISTSFDIRATGAVVGEVLPQIHVRNMTGNAEVERIATALRRGLAGFDTVMLIAAEPEDVPVRTRPGRSYVFHLSSAGDEGVFLELLHVSSGTVLVSRVVDTALDDAGINDRIADILSTVVTGSGVLYAHLESSHLHSALTRCIALNEHFYREQSEVRHEEAYRCLEGIGGENARSPVIFSELASLHLLAANNGYDYPPAASQERALALARRAVQLGPDSPFAHRAQGYVLSRTGAAEESLRWMRKAYQLNVFDLGMAASYAYALIFAGEYDIGTPLMERAVTAASARPTWWDYALALGHFMRDEPVAMRNAVATLGASPRAHYLAARLIAADLAGDQVRVAALVEELMRDHRRFASDPEGFFVRGHYPSDLTHRLVAALRKAGLSGAS